MRNSFLLLLTACIWGFAFVAQSVGMDYVDPFTFNCVRSLIGGLVLIPCISLIRSLRKKENMASGEREQPLWNKNVLLGGVLCGIILCGASNLQQFGILYTTVGKAGFITALYVVLVPIIGIFFKKRPSMVIWISVVLSVVGLYLLCISGSLTIGYGDILVFLCAVVFSAHIMVIDYFSPKVDGVVMSCIQFFVCGILSGVLMLLYEKPDIRDILAAWAPVLYAGVLSSGVAYTLQIIGQKGVNPAIASLILCLESVISAIAGWLILGQGLSLRELAGCTLMFAAIVLAQLPQPKKKQQKNGM